MKLEKRNNARLWKSLQTRTKGFNFTVGVVGSYQNDYKGFDQVWYLKILTFLLFEELNVGVD